MKKLLIFVLIAVAVVAILKYMDERAGFKRAEVRVQTMMDGWLAGGTSSDGHALEALRMWHHGSKYAPPDHGDGQASDEFDAWRREKRLFRKIKSYSIESIEGPNIPTHGAYLATVQIDGKPYAMKVERHYSIEWVD